MRGVRPQALLLFLVVGRDLFATEVAVGEAAPEPQPHPQLTPLGYQLSANKEHLLAARREQLKQQRLSALRARVHDAQTRGDTALAERLSAVINRVEIGPSSTKPALNAWDSEHVEHMRAVNQWLRYGAQLNEPQVVEEFDKHALRVAKLRRMRDVVKETPASAERDALLIDIETTLEMEGTRHVERLEQWLKPLAVTAP